MYNFSHTNRPIFCSESKHNYYDGEVHAQK